tara:strand:- start:53 stop:1120 length:1068 start_codon:yes stop_codon:yes gene_type:complete
MSKTVVKAGGLSLSDNFAFTGTVSGVFDDDKIVNDLSSLALREASNEDRVAYNSNSSSVDVFQDDSGIDTTSSTERNSSEYVSSLTSANTYGTGDRTSVYTITNNTGKSIEGNLNNWVDGATGNDTNDSWYFSANAQAISTGNNIHFDLGSGNSKVFTGMKIFENTASGTGLGAWRIQLSNDNSNWDTAPIGGSNEFTWGPSDGNGTTEHTWTNTTAYRYIRLKAEGAQTGNQKYQQEIQWRELVETVNASGNFTGTTITAPSSVSSMGAIITYQDNQGTNALNTDIILQLSADGGSNFTTATLEALPDFSTGIKMAKVNDVSVTAGTSLKYKILFANQSSGSKEARIRGVSLQY